jgi:hypothetical protein
MGKAVVSIARLVTIHMMTIRRVLRVVLAHTAIKFFNFRMFRANHARRVGTLRPKVFQVWTIATNARRERKTHTKVPLWVRIVRSVLPTPFQKQQGPLSAMHASLAVRLLLQVFVVPCAQKEQRKRGPTQTITPVSGVLPVSGPTVMPTNALIVQKDFIPITLNRTVAMFVKQVGTIRQ